MRTLPRSCAPNGRASSPGRSKAASIGRSTGSRRPTRCGPRPEEYLLAEDMFAAWLDDACQIGPSAWDTSHHLFESWSAWAERANEPKPRRRQFADALLAHGFTSQRGTRGERGFQGLKLKPWSGAG